MSFTVGRTFEVTGWQGTGGITLGLRFGSENAGAWVDRSWNEIQVEFDGISHGFAIRPSFWRKCPEIRGAAITTWMRRHGLAPWPKNQPPHLKLVYLGQNRYRAELPTPGLER